MIFRLLTLFLAFFVSFTAFGQTDLSYFLPQEVTYNKNIPTPEDYLGYPIGKWHISHDQLVGYMKTLAAVSDRFTIEEYGRSHEDRPMLLLTITAPQNHKNIEAIRTEHLKLTNPDEASQLNLDKMPVVVYQGYSIHGNESSGANAVPLYAYYLAAAEGKAIEKVLEETVILLDPCYNPDGLNRFASWVNSHKSKNLTGDPSGRELNETWPGGRTNHYWFDLNRDWLLLQHPESQGRMAKFHTWKPNVLTDHHEMGSNATFFFQPGIPSRTFPLTPQMNQDLTAEIGTYHAKKLDAIGSLYYTKESYDDFYIGKGSTYPDVNGCIGILFEQASSRGHLQKTDNGLLSFPFTIRNQFTTSLSTLEAAHSMRLKLLSYQRDFFKNTLQEAKQDKINAYVFGDEYDAVRTSKMVDLLLKHQIEVYPLTKDLIAEGKTFKAKKAYVVPLNQTQYKVIKGLFITMTSFKDSLFYDISTWTMPLAFNLPYAELLSTPEIGERLLSVPKNEGKIIGGESNYAYLFTWDSYYAPRALGELLRAGVMAKVASTPFSIPTSEGVKRFELGTILIPVAMQHTLDKKALFDLLKKVATRDNLDVYSVSTGLTDKGINLGSNNFEPLKAPKVLLLIGDGVTSYDAGEVWHLLDQRYEMPITLVESENLNAVDLSTYNTLVLVNGQYNRISNSTVSKLKDWVRDGGTVIGFKSAINWLRSNNMMNIRTKRTPDQSENVPYTEISKLQGAQVIGGAIFETEIDLTHPLAYGYHNSKIPVFRRGTLFFEPTNKPSASPLKYTNNPLLSGYISKPNLETIKKTASIIINGMGRGRVIGFADNTNFRAFWYGTNKLFANAIFFGSTINGNSVEYAED